MKTWPKIRLFLVSVGVALACVGAATNQGIDAAIQAIQQAPDPSAAIAAYANGFSLDRNDPGLYAAYVSRMVDLGLPEMAYRQAQTLTTIQPSNGLAWAVVGFVDARRAQMPEAVAAINLAGRFTPENTFVQHTAGELVAWYDFKADKSKIPDNAKEGLTKLRNSLDKQTAFTEAYSTARKAYETAATSSSQTAETAGTQASPAATLTNQAAPPSPNISQLPPILPAPTTAEAQADQVAPLGYAVPTAAPLYYPDYSGLYLDWGPSYCYGWGAGWVAPAPWWWWEPCGFWGGGDFLPFGVSFVFGDFDDFHHFPHDGFHHDERFGHDDHFGHGDFAGRIHDPARWHGTGPGHHDFFGMPARPTASVSQWARVGSQPRAPSAASAEGVSAHWWSRPARSSALAMSSPLAGTAPGSLAASRWGGAGSSRSFTAAPSSFSPVGGRSAAPLSVARPSIGIGTPPATAAGGRSSARNAIARTTAPTFQAGQSLYGRGYNAPRPAPNAGLSSAYRSPSTPRTSVWSAPSHRASVYSAPHFAVPSASGGAWRGSMTPSVPRSFGGGPSGFRGGGSFGGSMSRGGSYGGGFHSGGADSTAAGADSTAAGADSTAAGADVAESPTARLNAKGSTLRGGVLPQRDGETRVPWPTFFEREFAFMRDDDFPRQAQAKA